MGGERRGEIPNNNHYSVKVATLLYSGSAHFVTFLTQQPEGTVCVSAFTIYIAPEGNEYVLTLYKVKVG